MKRYKIKAILTFLAFLLQTGVTFASSDSKTVYFRRYLIDWGFGNLLSYSQGNGEFPITNGTQDIVIVSSRIEDLSELVFDKYIFLICDDDYVNEEFNFSCNRESYTSENIVIISDMVSIGLFELHPQDKSLIVIPQDVFALKETRDSLGEFIKSLKLRENQVENYISSSVDERATFYEEFIKSPFFDIFLYVLLIVFASFFVRNLSREYFYYKKNARFSVLLRYKLKRFVEIFKPHQGFFIAVLAGLIILYVPIFIALSIKDVGSIDPNYISDLFEKTLNVRNFSQNGKNTYFMFALFLYHVVVLLLFLYVVIFYHLSKAATVLSHLKKAGIKEVDFKRAIMVTLNILIFMSFISDYHLRPFFICSGLLLIWIFVFILKWTSGVGITFSKTEKVRALRALIFTVIFALVLGIALDIRRYRYNYEPLFGVSNRIVMLPYSKNHGENELFRSNFVDNDNPVFADSYCVFYPGYNRVENLNLVDFSNKSDFVILSSEDEESLMTEVLSIPLLIDRFQSSIASNTLYFSNSDDEGSTLYQMKVSLDCDNISDAYFDVGANLYSLSGEEGEVSDSFYELFSFPGCSDNEEEITYLVSLESAHQDILTSDRVVLSLDIPDTVEINGFDILRNNEEVDVFPLDIKLDGPILGYSLGDSTDTLYVYSIDTTVPMSFEMRDEPMDISVPLNELKRQKLLNNPFIIWSPVHDVIIKNEYLDDF